MFSSVGDSFSTVGHGRVSVPASPGLQDGALTQARHPPRETAWHESGFGAGNRLARYTIAPCCRVFEVAKSPRRGVLRRVDGANVCRAGAASRDARGSGHPSTGGNAARWRQLTTGRATPHGSPRRARPALGLPLPRLIQRLDASWRRGGRSPLLGRVPDRPELDPDGLFCAAEGWFAARAFRFFLHLQDARLIPRHIPRIARSVGTHEDHVWYLFSQYMRGFDEVPEA